MLTFIEFCSGIGGMRCAMQKNGHKCLGYSDIERFNQIAYRELHETEGLWFCEDLKDLVVDDIPYADCYCISCPNIGVDLIKLIGLKKPRFVIFEGDYLSGERMNSLEKLGYYIEIEVSKKKWRWPYIVAQKDTRFNILPIPVDDYIPDEDSWLEKGFPVELLRKLSQVPDFICVEGNTLIRFTQINAFYQIIKKIQDNLEGVES